jgi:hypothetical protein
MARPVLSQPPPGAAGINMLIDSNIGFPCAQAGKDDHAMTAPEAFKKSLFEHVAIIFILRTLLVVQIALRGASEVRLERWAQVFH